MQNHFKSTRRCSFVWIFVMIIEWDMCLSQATWFIINEAQCFPIYCYTTALSLQSTLEYKWASSPSSPSIPPSLLHPLFFAHSYDSWAVLSHTRLLKITGDADDNEYVDDDDGSNYVFWMSCFYFRVFLLSFPVLFFKKEWKRSKKKKKESTDVKSFF